MKLCLKCKLEKPESKYYTHSNGRDDKPYVRNVCNECMYENVKRFRAKKKEEKEKMKQTLTEEKKVSEITPEPPTNVFEDNPDYRKCSMCMEHKPSTDFYKNYRTGYYHTRCKKCHNEYTGIRQKEYYEEKYKNNGGSERIIPKPNQYTDVYQKEQTHWLMNLLGWTYNDNGVWSKEGIKNKDKEWDKIPKKIKEIKLRKSRYILTQEDIERIFELRKQGTLMREIAVIYKCSKTTIGKILKKKNN
jgi:hypothetical protein